MKYAEASVVNFAHERARRKTLRRTAKIPRVVDNAVALIKAAERKALLQALDHRDPAVSELLRVAASTYDEAAKLVLVAYDDLTRRPTL